MSESTEKSASARVYRVDRYVVPEASREDFLERVGSVHAMLRTFPGFVRDLVLEQPSDTGGLRIVTLVEWESPDALKHARAEVMAAHPSADVDRRAALSRLGVTADTGDYRSLAV